MGNGKHILPVLHCLKRGSVFIRVFIIDYVMHGRPIFFVLPGTITLIYDYDYDCFCFKFVDFGHKFGGSLRSVECPSSYYLKYAYTVTTRPEGRHQWWGYKKQTNFLLAPLAILFCAPLPKSQSGGGGAAVGSNQSRGV